MLKSVTEYDSHKGFTKKFLIGFALLWALTACEHPSPWAYLQEKETLAKNMHIQMVKALSAQKNALIAARTDVAQSFVTQAKIADQTLEKSRQSFAKIPEKEKTPEQNKAFQEFSLCWSQLEVLNQELLKLAVQNTNTQAQELSIHQAAQALTSFESSLKKLSPDSQPNLAFHSHQALIAALQIQVLHLPHILSAEDPEMDLLDQRIENYDQVAQSHLLALSKQADPQDLKASQKFYQQFKQISDQVFKLSRQNTNITSTKLELGKKDLVASACDKSMTDLQAAIDAQNFKATR